jgi:DNA-directed RNA polymerase specialized sigma24 family protein
MHPKSADQRFGRVFGANFDAIQAYCLRRLPAEEAADAVSEVFLVAWRRIEASRRMNRPGFGSSAWHATL